MANPLILKRLEGVRDMLVALFQSSDKVLSSQHSSVTGPEREIFVAHFLHQILPPIYRIGSGVITDTQGNISTQIDVVLELPFTPSFSFLDGTPRIYPADTIGAVIEVKSDLNGYLSPGKPGNVYGKFIDNTKDEQNDMKYIPLKHFKRRVSVITEIVKTDDGFTLVKTDDNFTIPAYAVGYRGFTAEKTLQDHIDKLNDSGQFNLVRGILQLGYNSSDTKHPTLFVGSEGRVWKNGAALGAFINSLHWELHRTSPLSWPDLPSYYE